MPPYNNFYSRINRKTISIFLLVLIVLIIGSITVYFVLDYFSKGTVKITSSSGAQISLLDQSKGVYSKKLLGKGQYTGRFDKGNYSFLVEDGDKSTMRTVGVQPRTSQAFDVKLKEISSPNMVLNAQAIDIQASSVDMNYINASYYYLEKYIFGAKRSTTYPIAQAKNNITSAQWVGDRKALLSFSNSAYALLDNTKVTFFSPLPKDQAGEGADSKFVINQIMMNKNYSILSLLSSSVYYQKDIYAAPTKVVDKITADNITLAFANDNHYAYSAVLSNVDPEANKPAKSGDLNIYLGNAIGGSEKEVIESKSPVSCLVFSPNSLKLLFCNAEGLFVYDTQSKKTQNILTRVAQKPSLTSWVGDNQIIYFDNQALWQVDLANQTLYKLVGSIDVTYVVEVAVSEDSNKFYYTIKKPGTTNPVSNVYSIGITAD